MLSICISTFAERINCLKLPEYREGVDYIVIHQVESNNQTLKAPEKLVQRSDCKIFSFKEKGLSKSRNRAIRLVSNPYFMLMDDDVDIHLSEVIETIDKMKKENIDIGTCKHHMLGGVVKKYPKYEKMHTIFTAANVSSIDIICKTNTVNNKALLFNEDFGLGSKYLSGEEYIFIVNGIQLGLKIKFYDTYCSTHPEISSGADFYTDPQKILAKRKMFLTCFGSKGIIFALIFWFKKLPYVIKNKHALLFTRYMLLG